MLFILLQSDKGAKIMYRVFQKEFSNGCHWQINFGPTNPKVYTRIFNTNQE